MSGWDLNEGTPVDIADLTLRPPPDPDGCGPSCVPSSGCRVTARCPGRRTTRVSAGWLRGWA